MSEPLLVVSEAFPARGGGVTVMPKIVLRGREGASGSFSVRLELPDGTTRQAIATLDVAHIRGPNGAFALVRLHAVTPEEVPPGTTVTRLVESAGAASSG